jgi:phosphoglycerate kinase
LDNLFHIEDLKPGEVGILENIRRSDGEMTNSPKIAKELVGLAVLYVNEAFAVSHRTQASIVEITKYLPAYIGPLFFKEYENLAKAFTPKHPFLFILGGMKFKTKIPLLKKFIKKADTVFVGGALANSFYKKLGYEIGKSLANADLSGMTEFLQAKNFLLPADVVTEASGNVFVRLPEKVKTKETISDIGPDAVVKLKEQIKEAKFILWNGPMGNFEKGFNRGTLEIARAVAQSKAFSVVGGGDTVSAIADLNLTKEFGFVSTAGGAMLEFLASGTLPGIEAILKSKGKGQNSKVKVKSKK